MSNKKLHFDETDPITPILKRYAAGKRLTANELGRVGAWARKQKGRDSTPVATGKKSAGRTQIIIEVPNGESFARFLAAGLKATQGDKKVTFRLDTKA